MIKTKLAPRKRRAHTSAEASAPQRGERDADPSRNGRHADHNGKSAVRRGDAYWTAFRQRSSHNGRRPWKVRGLAARIIGKGTARK